MIVNASPLTTGENHTAWSTGLLMLIAGLWMALQLFLPWFAWVDSNKNSTLLSVPLAGYRHLAAMVAVATASLPLIVAGVVFCL